MTQEATATTQAATSPNPASRMFLFFSHKLSPEQVAEAQSMGVTEFVHLPEHLQDLFSNINPHSPDLETEIKLFMDWLKDQNPTSDDFALVQGDFGLTYGLVRNLYIVQNFEFDRILYATTDRVSEEVLMPDGSIKTTRVFKHARFRPYSNFIHYV